MLASYQSHNEWLVERGRALTFNLEECRQQLELVFLGRDGIGQLLAVVERLQQGLEAIVYQRHLVCHLRRVMDWRMDDVDGSIQGCKNIILALLDNAIWISSLRRRRKKVLPRGEQASGASALLCHGPGIS